jgi:cell division cycle 14
MTRNQGINGAAILHAVTKDKRLHIAQNIHCSLDQIFHCFSTDGIFEYEPLLDEYGPLKLLYVIRFVEIIDSKTRMHPEHKIVHYSGPGKRKLTNAVYLLGAYMVLKHGDSAEMVSKCFHWLDDSLIEPYRGTRFSESNSDDVISLLDCWSALERVKNLAWLDLPSHAGGQWGLIDPDEYEHYSNPLNADLHQIIPGKLIALRAPMDLHGLDYFDDKGHRHFSPSYFAPIFLQLGVSSVMSLNEPAYFADEFESRGLRHHVLAFGPWAVPSTTAVDAFFRIADAAPGAVAVHSAGGYGRTGTLAALYLMRRHGFRAREAVAWLRVCRPGSVDGEQHAFLCRLEAVAAAITVDTGAISPRSTGPARSAGSQRGAGPPLSASSHLGAGRQLPSPSESPLPITSTQLVRGFCRVRPVTATPPPSPATAVAPSLAPPEAAAEAESFVRRERALRCAPQSWLGNCLPRFWSARAGSRR